MNTKFIVTFVLLLVITTGIIVWLSSAQSQTPKAAEFNGTQATIYMGPTCGCCKNYASYLQREGFDVETKVTDDMDSVKSQNNIPKDLISCHTTIIGDYVVEGHIPVEAMVKLLKEKPEIRGIAMAGMPSGSPGMPGKKNSPFEIYKLTKELAGQTQEDVENELFMEY